MKISKSNTFDKTAKILIAVSICIILAKVVYAAYMYYDAGTGYVNIDSNFIVNGDAKATGNLYEGSSNRVCTVANGLCGGGGGSSGGWTNTSTMTTANLNVNITGNLYLHGNLTGYDLAEFISSDGTLEAGDVVEIDSSRIEGIKKSSTAYDTKVAGIVSTDPGMKMNKNDDMKNKVPLALSGRVPIKVTTEGGMIEAGDLLTTSSTPGYAMKCDDRAKCFGALVGKALEPYSKSGPGKITALVSLG